MTHDEHLKQHLDLCKTIYLRMLKDGSWPWRDSTKIESLIESEEIPTKL
jgi:hypothetical protein